jgi:phage virion morphogenesis protein
MDKLIEVKVDDERVRQVMTELARRVRNRTPAMKICAGIMANAVEENFEKEGRPEWKELAEATIKQREKEGTWPGKILQRSGQLAASISRHYDNDKAVVSTNKVYAAIQNFGGKAGRGKKVTIPAREFMKLDEPDKEKIVKRMGDYLTRGL